MGILEGHWPCTYAPEKTRNRNLITSRGKFDLRLTIGRNLIRLLDRTFHPSDLLLSDLGLHIGTRICCRISLRPATMVVFSFSMDRATSNLTWARGQDLYAVTSSPKPLAPIAIGRLAVSDGLSYCWLPNTRKRGGEAVPLCCTKESSALKWIHLLGLVLTVLVS